jgi:hypothetical protein
MPARALTGARAHSHDKQEEHWRLHGDEIDAFGAFGWFGLSRSAWGFQENCKDCGGARLHLLIKGLPRVAGTGVGAPVAPAASTNNAAY